MGFLLASVFAAAVLPYALLLLTAIPSPTTLARWGPQWSNRDIRESLARLQGWRLRAQYAQMNGHEAFAPFAAAMLGAHLAAAPSSWIHPLAVAFLAARVLHAIAYITDRPTLRSSAWGLGAISVAAIFIVAIAA